jgi:molybdopterin molybdotransferase
LIHTGGSLPEGATAVVMREYTQAIPGGEIEIFRPAAIGENVLKIGEEVGAGEIVIPKGKRLRPVEVGGLMALGITSIDVVQQARIAIISSGDEIVPADASKKPGQIRDVNAPALAALVEGAGGIPVFAGIAPDRVEVLAEMSAQAFRDSDLLIITAGSSISARDHTAQVINQLGEPGVVIHGINIRPGKPTILGVCDGKPVVGLPGNPLSAMVIARLFVLPVMDRLHGLLSLPFPRQVKAQLSVNLPSQAGREDWIPVKVISAAGSTFIAEPIFSRSNFIFNLVQADGLVKISEDATGVNAGAIVDVWVL